MHCEQYQRQPASVAGSCRLALSTACVSVVAALLTGCGADDVRPPAGSTTTSAPPSTTATEPTVGSSTSPATVGSSTAPPASSAGSTAPASSPGWPAFESSVEPVGAERLGPTWRPGCPVGPDDLRLVRVSHATPDGATATGELVVAADAADDVIAAFAEIYAARFPITRMTTIDAYGGDDDESMAEDNTSAFNCRAVTGGTGWSRHSYGLAIDINPLRNPYVNGDTVLPPAGQAYLDRTDVRAGMIVAGDVVVVAFTSRGFEWGGDFDSLKDYQHFDR